MEQNETTKEPNASAAPLPITSRLPAWPIGDSTLIAGEDLLGQRIDSVLTPLFGTPRAIKEAIQNGYVFYNGSAPWGSPRLRLGDVISVFSTEPQLRPEANPLNVLYEDGYLLVVEKPAGIPMYPGPGWPCRTVANAVRALGKVSGLKGDIRAGILGRLDREVSGVIMVARDEEVHQAIVRAYVNREVRRRYLAMVAGKPTEGSSDRWLSIRRQGRSGYRAVPPETEHAIPAQTFWRPIGEVGEATLLEVLPVTGKRHQIRVHLSAAGFPILGDRHYGGELGRLREKGGVDGKMPPMSRIALHLETLEVVHPKTKEWMRFYSPWPKELPQIL